MKNCTVVKVTLLVLSLLASHGYCQSDSAGGLKMIQTHEKCAIHIGDSLFTELHLKGFARPILYPVHGPKQTPMTRNHPMKKGVTGEADDHPHHKSIWCGHGLINGISFWHEEGKIEVDTSQPMKIGVSEDGKSGTLTFRCNYTHDNKTICTDETTLTFHDLGDSRAVDWDVTITASEGAITFGDTKEGMMATRTHPQLRIDRGAKAINSEGVKGKDIWGKHAKWVDYTANVEGNEVGMAIFDHPKNLRHPTTWHARAYGLVAANPFGRHHFEGAEKGAGDHKLDKGKSIRFRYRIVFHPGKAGVDSINKMYDEFAAQR